MGIPPIGVFNKYFLRSIASSKPKQAIYLLGFVSSFMEHAGLGVPEPSGANRSIQICPVRIIFVLYISYVLN